MSQISASALLSRVIAVSTYVGIVLYIALALLLGVVAVNIVAPSWSYFHTFETFSFAVVISFPLWSRRWVTKRFKRLVPRSLSKVPELALLAVFVYAFAHLLRVILTT